MKSQLVISSLLISQLKSKESLIWKGKRKKDIKCMEKDTENAKIKDKTFNYPGVSLRFTGFIIGLYNICSLWNIVFILSVVWK